MLAHLFGPVDDWPSADLVAFSEEFDAPLAIAGYQSGVFPMPLHDTGFDGYMGWWSPLHRGILPLDRLRVTRSLRQSAKRYRTTIDAAFDQVIARCAEPNRDGGWIDTDVVKVYTQLFRLGIAHSVETWDADGRLVGGLYGVALGGLFAGESMFHDAELGRDASKIALVRLVSILAADRLPRLLDVQWRTDHLGSLGVIEVSRNEYLRRLDAALDLPPIDWDAARLASSSASHYLTSRAKGSPHA